MSEEQITVTDSEVTEVLVESGDSASVELVDGEALSVVLEQEITTVEVVGSDQDIAFVEIGIEGPPGPEGPMGPMGTAEGGVAATEIYVQNSPVANPTAPYLRFSTDVDGNVTGIYLGRP